MIVERASEEEQVIIWRNLERGLIPLLRPEMAGVFRTPRYVTESLGKRARLQFMAESQVPCVLAELFWQSTAI